MLDTFLKHFPNDSYVKIFAYNGMRPHLACDSAACGCLVLASVSIG